MFPTFSFAVEVQIFNNMIKTGEIRLYKKVLLRERKRDTARRVASARFADLSPDGGGGGIPSSLEWGDTPSCLRQGNTPSSLDWDLPHHVLDGGTSSSLDWKDTRSSPIQILDEGTPVQIWETFPIWTWDGLPLFRPQMGYPHQQDEVPCPSRPGMGCPTPTWDGIPSDAGDKNEFFPTVYQVRNGGSRQSVFSRRGDQGNVWSDANVPLNNVHSTDEVCTFTKCFHAFLFKKFI